MSQTVNNNNNSSTKGFWWSHLKTFKVENEVQKNWQPYTEHASQLVTALEPQPFPPQKHLLIARKSLTEDWFLPPVTFSVKVRAHSQVVFQALQKGAVRLKILVELMLICNKWYLQEFLLTSRPASPLPLPSLQHEVQAVETVNRSRDTERVQSQEPMEGAVMLSAFSTLA
jgi:hypothetical protein